MGHFPFFEAYEETLLTQKFKSISLGIFKFIIRFSKKKKKKIVYYPLTLLLISNAG